MATAQSNKTTQTFIDSVNSIIDLAKIHKEDLHHEFVNQHFNEKSLTPTMYKSLVYMYRVLSKELHPDRQISSNNPLPPDVSRELQGQLNTAYSFMTKHKHLYENINLEYGFNHAAYKNDEIKQKTTKTKQEYSQSNHNFDTKSEPYANIKSKAIKSMFEKWDKMDRNQSEYFYNTVVKDVFSYLKKERNTSGKHESMQHLISKINNILNKDGGNAQVQYQKAFNKELFSLTLTDFNLVNLTELKLFANQYNQHVFSPIELISDIKEIAQPLFDAIINSFINGNKNIIRNIILNQDEIENLFSGCNLTEVNTHEILPAIKKIKNTKHNKVLVDFLLNTNVLDLSEIGMEKSFIFENFVSKLDKESFIDDEGYYQYFNKPYNFDPFDDNDDLRLYKGVVQILQQSKKTGARLAENDCVFIGHYIEQLVFNQALAIESENLIVDLFSNYLSHTAPYQYIKNQDFLTNIQDLRDGHLEKTLADLCFKKDKVINLSVLQIQDYKDYKPLKALRELENLKYDGIEETTIYKQIQADYQNQSIGMLHKNNIKFQFVEFFSGVLYHIANDTNCLGQFNIDEKIEYAIKKQGMTNLLPILLESAKGSDEFYNTLYDKISILSNHNISEKNKNEVYAFLNTYCHKDTEQWDVRNVKFRDSLMFDFLNKKHHGELAYKIGILDDLKLFRDIEKSVHGQDTLLSKMTIKFNQALAEFQPLSFIQNKAFLLFNAYEEGDVRQVKTLMSKMNVEDMSYKGMPLPVYMAYKELTGTTVKNNHDMVRVIYQSLGNFVNKEQALLNMTTPYAKMSGYDLMSAHNRSDIEDVIRAEKILSKIGKKATWYHKVFKKSDGVNQEELNNEHVKTVKIQQEVVRSNRQKLK